jgi:subtilase family protein
VTDVSRALRGTLPLITALTVAASFMLPGSALAATPTRTAQWWLPALGVPQAWKAAPAEGKGVTVALLSTGVNATHPDLIGNVITGPDFSHSGRSPGGPFWGIEGTAAASLIAGHGHGPGDAAGITGIAPDARILSLQVTLEYNDPLNSDSAITRLLPAAIAAGIRYAVGHGASVIALPLDPGTLGPATTGDPAAAGGSAAEQAAVGYALSHNVVLVAPAGDNGAGTKTVNYPAAYPEVIAVGATGKDGQLTSFTSTRSYVAFTAPGSGLTEAAPNGYDSIATSDMSAALTAGAAALIRSRYPALTAAEVTRALESGAVPGSHAPGHGHGALNAARALAAAAAAQHAPARHAAPSASGHTAAVSHPAAKSGVARSAGLSTVARSILRDGLIAVGVLIVAVACVLIGSATRRRRRAAQPAQPPRAGHGGAGHGHARGVPHGSHTRRALAVIESETAQAPFPARPAARGMAGAGGRPVGSAADPGRLPPRIVPLAGAGTLGPLNHAQRKKTEDKPPWEPARPPGQATAADAAPPAAPGRVPPAVLSSKGPGAPGAKGKELPPWEQSANGYAAAPVPADLPDWSMSNSGPMYVWNPAANTGPFPAAPEPGFSQPTEPSEPESDPNAPPGIP